MVATYPLTGSTLNSTISTGLSTQILIKVENETVGAIQELTVNHSRPLERVKELGLDGILEIAPKGPTEYEISVKRIVFDRLRLPEAFSRGFINIKAQLLPFTIVVIDRTNGDGDGAVVHTLVNCWFTRYSPSYTADTFILSEQATIYCEDVSTTLGTSQSSAVQGGSRGVQYQVNSRERETDTGAGGSASGGGFRGTMDVSDIINATFE
jgi:hypothetical protein